MGKFEDNLNLSEAFETYLEQMQETAHENFTASRVPEGSLALTGTMYLQPLVDRNKHIIGMEALLRKKMPDGSVQGPMELLDNIKQSGSGEQYNLYIHMLEQSCHFIQRLHETGLEGQNLYISVNADEAALANKNLVRDTLDILDAYGVSPHEIKVEIVENRLPSEDEGDDLTEDLWDRAHIVNNLCHLQHNGIKTVLDDVLSKTGFNNNSRIHEFFFAHSGGEPDQPQYYPASSIKLDRDLFPSASQGSMSTEKLEEYIKGTLVYEYMMGMAIFKNHADLEPVVAEGIKHEDMEFVDSVFGHYPNLLFQAFIFHEPQKPDDVFKLIMEQSQEWSPPEKQKKPIEEPHEIVV